MNIEPFIHRREIGSPWRALNSGQQALLVLRAARLRGPGERANAQLRFWRILHKLRCSPHRVGRLAKAIHALPDYEVATG